RSEALYSFSPFRPRDTAGRGYVVVCELRRHGVADGVLLLLSPSLGRLRR
ncbi:RNA cap guanine-N2 methyltransferase, partial [Toxoplasma gondii TgCatPRC2]